MEQTAEQKIEALRKKLPRAKTIDEYKTIRARIAGLSGDRRKKAEAGKKGGRGRKKDVAG